MADGLLRHIPGASDLWTSDPRRIENVLRSRLRNAADQELRGFVVRAALGAGQLKLEVKGGPVAWLDRYPDAAKEFLARLAAGTSPTPIFRST
jgi:hypothetical protein